MKKLLAVLLVLSLAWALSALAEGSLEEAVEAMQSAATLDEQLARLYDLSVDYGAELEKGAWDLGLTCIPAESLPGDLFPPSGETESLDRTVEDFEGSKFIAIYSDEGTIRLLGDFQARIPESIRAASLEEADAVLYLAHTSEACSDYTGPAYNRVYTVYVYRRGEAATTTAYRTFTTPPVSGYGVLTGETLMLSDLWAGLRPWFYGTIDVTYPEGTATYRVTGQSCCLANLEGDFIRYEIPSEVEGHPVTGIEYCYSETLEELVLPEGIAWIQIVAGPNITRMNFPSSLRRIAEDLPRKLEEMALNEGLEEIGDFAVLSGNGESFALPSTLKSIGRGTLEYGADCPYIIVPEGVTALPDYFLMDAGWVVCAYVPASVTSFGSDLFDYGGVRVFTPEDSPAARWASREGYDWVPCASAEEMPKPEYAEQDGFKYAIVAGEAVIVAYNGDAACVRIPDTLGGCPVTVVCEDSFCDLDALRAILFPDTVRRIEGWTIDGCPSLEAVFMPASVTDFHFQAVLSCEKAVIYAPAGSTVAENLDHTGDAFKEWTPGAEDAWFAE